MTLEKNLKKLINTRNKNSKFYIVGDFNSDVLKIDQFQNIPDFVDMMYQDVLLYNALMLLLISQLGFHMVIKIAAPQSLIISTERPLEYQYLWNFC